MINLCYHLTLTLCCITMDGDKFLLTINFCPVFIQSSSEINHHLDKLSLGEGRYIKFISSVGIMTRGAPVHHDHCMKIFL